MPRTGATVGEIRRVIIDTDPGVDDTMAIMLALASPELRVEGLTIVFGNVGVEQCARNALAILDIAGRSDIPVAVGADQPLVRPYHGHGHVVHGRDGLGDTHLAGTRAIPDRRAVDFLIARITEEPNALTIIALGPLTNLALALSVEPRISRWVREVVIMGGSVTTRGNATPVAEANIHNDPEAARIVFHAGWPVTLVGLDVTHKVIMTPAYLGRLAAARTPVAALIAKITPFYMNAARQLAGIDGIFVHDPTAVAAAIRPALFDIREVYVDVVTDSARALGQTIADFRQQWKMPPNLRACVDVDTQGMLDFYFDRVTAYRVPA